MLHEFSRLEEHTEESEKMQGFGEEVLPEYVATRKVADDGGGKKSDHEATAPRDSLSGQNGMNPRGDVIVPT